MYPVTKLLFKRFHGNSKMCACWTAHNRTITLRSNLPCFADIGFNEFETYLRLLCHESLHSVFCSLGECRGCNGLDRGLDIWLGENFGIDCVCNLNTI